MLCSLLDDEVRCDDDDEVEVGCDGDGKSEAETDVRERKDLPDSTFFH